MDKISLREYLNKACAEFTGEVVLYAKQRKPDRMPWKSGKDLRSEVYRNDIAELERIAAAQKPRKRG